MSSHRNPDQYIRCEALTFQSLNVRRVQTLACQCRFRSRSKHYENQQRKDKTTRFSMKIKLEDG